MIGRLPFVSCICPTYKRPRLLENVIACYMAQDYPADRRELVICDDAQQIKSQSGDGWVLFSVQPRFSNLPEKYNYLASIAKGDVLAVWEDDDIYLPNHISANIAAMLSEGRGWSHNKEAWSLYTGELLSEPAHGRFHASLVISRNTLTEVGGWPNTNRLDFDQRLIGKLTSLEQPAEPAQSGYVFRWASTGSYHAQTYGEDWYEKIGRALADVPPVDKLNPAFDAETRRVYEILGG